MEAHLAHQDVTMQNLSDNAAKQWAAIDKLEQAVQHLKERFRALEETSRSASTDGDPPPPHY
jgi:uncharacterized coiled-coil protein SlyX